MALETVSIRCDRCGARETVLDAEKPGAITFTQGVIQFPVAGQARQIQFHLCPVCQVAEPFFPNAGLAKANGADIAALNREGRRHGG
jgi:hypothetical protein